jgi:hypothetical protein
VMERFGSVSLRHVLHSPRAQSPQRDLCSILRACACARMSCIGSERESSPGPAEHGAGRSTAWHAALRGHIQHGSCQPKAHVPARLTAEGACGVRVRAGMGPWPYAKASLRAAAELRSKAQAPGGESFNGSPRMHILREAGYARGQSGAALRAMGLAKIRGFVASESHPLHPVCRLFPSRQPLGDAARRGGLATGQRGCGGRAAGDQGPRFGPDAPGSAPRNPHKRAGRFRLDDSTLHRHHWGHTVAAFGLCCACHGGGERVIGHDSWRHQGRADDFRGSPGLSRP